MGYKTKEWRDHMRVTLDYNNMTDKFLGDKGFTPKQLASYNTAASAAFAYVKENRGKDELYMGWTELPYNQKEIVADILATARNVRRKFQYFVVLGIGGSALGPIMAFNALCHLHYNDLPKSVRKGPKFYVEDNVDPVRMKDLPLPSAHHIQITAKDAADLVRSHDQFILLGDLQLHRVLALDSHSPADSNRNTHATAACNTLIRFHSSFLPAPPGASVPPFHQ